MSKSNPTRDDFAALLEESFSAGHSGEGQVVRGTVTAIEKDMAIIDVGLKVEGRVPLKEFGAKAKDGRGDDKAKRDPASADGGIVAGTDFYFEDQRQFAKVRQLYRKLDKTQEWVENNYYHLAIQLQNAELVKVNAFWRDYAAHDPNAPFLSKNLAGVAIPVNADIPSDITVHFVEEVDEKASPIGGKGIGELGATGVAAAVANAVFHATGKRIRDLPITPEKLVAHGAPSKGWRLFGKRNA